VEGLKKAMVDDIMKVSGITRKDAEAVWAYFHRDLKF